MELPHGCDNARLTLWSGHCSVGHQARQSGNDDGYFCTSRAMGVFGGGSLTFQGVNTFAQSMACWVQQVQFLFATSSAGWPCINHVRLV